MGNQFGGDSRNNLGRRYCGDSVSIPDNVSPITKKLSNTMFPALLYLERDLEEGLSPSCCVALANRSG
jgi:hypothetical protein